MPRKRIVDTADYDLLADVETENFNLGNGVLQKRSRVQTMSLPRDTVLKALQETDSEYLTISFAKSTPLYTNIEHVALHDNVDADVLIFPSQKIKRK